MSTIEGECPPAVLQAWESQTRANTQFWIPPDGCRDLIWRHAPGRPPQWLVVPLSDTAYEVRACPGELFLGWRFHPGARVDDVTLLRAVTCRPQMDTAAVLPLIDSHVQRDPRVDEALAALAAMPSLVSTQRALGLSERSLQRWLGTATGRPPAYWRGLARARRAGAALASGQALVALAADAGYADQAHMTREFMRWFGLTPARLRAMPERVHLLAESGYGSAFTA